jgi:hypothetical protein
MKNKLEVKVTNLAFGEKTPISLDCRACVIEQKRIVAVLLRN